MLTNPCFYVFGDTFTHFTFYTCDINRLSLICKWNSELLEASTLKSSKETGWSHISIWSTTDVDFLDLFVKGEIPECSPTLTLK